MDLTIVPSSDDIEPFYSVTHTKGPTIAAPITVHEDCIESHDIEADGTMFSSSPLLYPASSSPAPVPHKAKRKLFQSFASIDSVPKKPRIVGGFEVDNDDDAEEDLVENAHNGNVEDTTLLAGIPVSPSAGVAVDPSESHSADPTSPKLPKLFTSRLTPKTTQIETTSGIKINIKQRVREANKTYEQTIAQRSTTGPGRAKTAYYGIDIHKLMDEAKVQSELDEATAEAERNKAHEQELANVLQPTEVTQPRSTRNLGYSQMWTEKYRAKKFTDLVGDERTHRSVLRWLKAWDELVFPGTSKLKPKRVHEPFDKDKQHRKVLLLTGPPGLGKTTLAHVCAKQAGYEVLEINASDDRSRDVVRGRIKDVLGTETVRGIKEHGKARRAGRPVCVVVDEVDGVVSGAGGSGGEGGFMKALIDLIHLDQRNTNPQSGSGQKRKGDKFRQMRPLIMICNDVYAPALRPLRQSGLAEIIHVRKPALEKVVLRLKNVFDHENITCDNDAVRRLCESSWGLGTRKQNSFGSRGAGDGDIRSILVQGEWAAHKLRASSGQAHLTRKWVEAHLGDSTSSQRATGGGGTREVVERVFIEGAGLSNLPTKLSNEDARLVAESKTNPIGVADLRKRTAINALREMINTCGEHDRLMTDLFATYPTQVFQDDTFLSKPNASYEWLNFHDRLSSRIHSGQEWELNAYMGTSACGFHDLFASVDKGARSWNDEKNNHEEIDETAHPFSGLKADFAAHESEKANRTILTEFRSNFPAPLVRLYSSVDAIATELVPNVSKMLAPEVKPVVVGGANGSIASVRKENEKLCIKNAVRVMHALGIEFEKIRIENESSAHTNGGYALRMEPPLDTLTTYHLDKTSKPSSNLSSNAKPTIPTAAPASAPAPVRYAIRQVLSQELSKEKILQAQITRQARAPGLSIKDHLEEDKENQNQNQTQNQPRISATDLIASKSKSLGATLPTANVKRDFFGRPILQHISNLAVGKSSKHARNTSTSASIDETQRTWVSFHEGYSNAVRKYISLSEFMDGF